MHSISKKKFAKMYAKTNNEDEKEVIKWLEDAVKRKKSGEKCTICGGEIWAIGSAIAFQGCFTCITGETDDSEDYEIDEVNY